MKQMVSPDCGSGVVSPPGSRHCCSSAAGNQPVSTYGWSFFAVTVDFTQPPRGAMEAAVEWIERGGRSVANPELWGRNGGKSTEGESHRRKSARGSGGGGVSGEEDEVSTYSLCPP